MRFSLVFVFLVVPVLMIPSAFTASTVTAVLVEQAPRIDGITDDPAWRLATPVTDFFQREPNPGQPVSEKTEVLVCYDLDRLYIAFRCYESDPAKITAKELARDVSLGEDDRVQIILDTFLDGRNGYWFQIGPRGSIGDALVSDNGFGFNKEWDGLWEGKAKIHAHGWDGELAIPFKTMSFKPNQPRWGMKLIRHIRRRLESSYWPVANLDTHRFQVSDSGILDGLEGISQGIGLDLSPYALGGFDQSSAAGTDAEGDAGLDAFYQITPALKSALTVNTDFAQTEVDARQINLTRFQLFFPEKRDFFLQGSNYFTFGPTGTRLIPFFSRRIGLDASGNPIPIVGGAKLTGQIGKWNLGFLDIVDDRSDRNPNFLVARVRRNLGSQSSVGMILTSGNALGPDDNQVVGADFRIASSTFRKNKNIALSFFGLKSKTDGLSGADAAFGTEFTYPNDYVNVTAGFHQIENNFRPGVGFVPRRDIRESYFKSALGPRPNRWGILQLLFELNFDYITNLENQLLTRELGFSPLHVRFRTGDEVAFTTSRQYERLDNNFAIHPYHSVPAGSYSFSRHAVTLQGAQRRNLWAGFRYRWGSFYNGERNDVSLAFGYKVSVPLYLGLELDRNRVELADGRFGTNVSRFNANILFSPDITLYNYLQYDNLSRNLGWQSRLRWILKPGNEILVVWNSKMYDPLERFELTESTGRIKLRYNYRF